MILGIDFGTCYSSAAVMHGQMPIADIFRKMEAGVSGIPTLFMYDGKEERYGKECFTAGAAIHSKDVIRHMKRTVRENPGSIESIVVSGGKKYQLSEVIKKYLSYLLTGVKDCAIASGEINEIALERIAITAPIGIESGHMTATDYNKLLIDTVMDLTGLPESKISILHEPVAAAISYFYSENMRMMYDRNQTVLVFDLGGGTFDVTVVEHDPFKQQYDIKAKEGDLKLGGNDWDEALGKLVLKKAGISGDFSSDEEKGEFQSQMTRLKHMLSELDVQPTVFRYNGKQITVTVERSEFEDATKHLLDRTIEVTKKAIDSCGGTSVIDEIVMVGGSSNMPQIRERIKAEFPQFGKYDIKLHDPSKAIAKGAAIYAKKMIDKCISFEGDVSDIVTHTYGISSRRVRDNKDMIYNLLYKGTKFEGESVTASSVSGFTALEDTQRYLTFTVYESDGIRGEGEDANWMDFGGNEKKNGIEATIAVPEEYIGRARSFSCLVTLEINRDGVLNMHITDKDGKLVNVKE